MWIDYRGIYDAAMRDAGVDYFENCGRATYASATALSTAAMGVNPSLLEGVISALVSQAGQHSPGQRKMEWRSIWS
jgi:hypothetical protein